MSDSAWVPVVKFGMWGKTEQVQTTGANLFDTSKTKIKFDNMSIWAKQCFDNAFITTTFKPNTKYYVKCKITMLSAVKNKKDFDMKKGIVLYNAKASRTVEIINHKSKMNDNETFVYSSSFTTPEDLTGYIINAYTERYTEQDGTGEYLSTIRIDDIIVSENNIPFEPYSGGFPSPDPEWEQPIEVTDKPITVTVKGGTEQQSITLVPPRTLTKWDKLEKINGVWKWVYQHDEYTVTGDENFVAPADSYTNGTSTDCYIAVIKDAIKKPNGIMERLSKIDSVWSKAGVVGFDLNVNQLHMRISNTLLGVSDDAIASEKIAAHKAYMKAEYEKGTPYHVIYETTTPEYIPLSQSEQNALNSLMMYTPTTEITNDGDCNMELTYTVDTKSYIDTKIAEISKAIL